MPQPEPVNRSVLLLFLLACLPACAADPSGVTIERVAPRVFGYQLGDVIREDLTIHLPPGQSLDEASLPRVGKRASWFTVKGLVLSTAPQDKGGTLVHLVLDMQLVNSPTVTRTLTIPPVAFTVKGKEPHGETIPSLTIDAVPLGTGEIRTGLPDVWPLRPAPWVPTALLEQHLQALGGVASVLGGWLALALAFRLWRPRKALPFAAARRDLRGVLRRLNTPEDARIAVQRLHRAFDLAAGQRLFSPGVPAFCQRMGVDAALQERTQAFFAASQALFFGTAGTAVPQGLGRDLAALCQAWQRFEGRHH